MPLDANLPKHASSRRSLESAVVIQRDHVRNIPWGISEFQATQRGTLREVWLSGLGIPALDLT